MLFGLCIVDTGCVEAVKEAGYDGFEFSGTVLSSMTDAEFEKLRCTAGDAKLPCFGINAYCAGIPAMIGRNYSSEQTLSYAQKVCERASLLGAANIGIGAPKARILEQGFEKEEADRQMKEFLEITCSTAEKYGMKVLLESIRREMCNYINTTTEVEEMLRAVPRDNLMTVYDFYHVQKEEADWAERFYALKPWIRHIHVSTDEPELKRGYPGEADRKSYENIFSVIKSSGYDGTISLEPSFYDIKQAEASLQMMKSVLSS